MMSRMFKDSKIQPDSSLAANADFRPLSNPLWHSHLASAASAPFFGTEIFAKSGLETWPSGHSLYPTKNSLVKPLRLRSQPTKTMGGALPKGPSLI